MSPTPLPLPSQILPGAFDAARRAAFTRWMSRDLLQASTDFCRNIGLYPLYAECSAEGTRYLCWNMPAGASCEVRSGRTKEKFIDYDRMNHERGWHLLSLHVSDDGLYSAVWLSADHVSLGAQYLSRFGILPAERKARD